LSWPATTCSRSPPSSASRRLTREPGWVLDAALTHAGERKVFAAYLHCANAELGRERCEVLVDCVTYVCCASVHLDVGGETIPYVAGWGEDGALDRHRQAGRPATRWWHALAGVRVGGIGPPAGRAPSGSRES
jgi:hypothetical protein